jgi:F-type H+-transporting ATPase subunit epsilon
MKFTLKVMAPDAILLDQAVKFVAIPGIDGELGLLPKRQQVLVRLKKGNVRYEALNGEKKSIPVQGGLAYNDGETVTVLLS